MNALAGGTEFQGYRATCTESGKRGQWEDWLAARCPGTLLEDKKGRCLNPDGFEDNIRATGKLPKHRPIPYSPAYSLLSHAGSQRLPLLESVVQDASTGRSQYAQKKELASLHSLTGNLHLKYLEKKNFQPFTYSTPSHTKFPSTSRSIFILSDLSSI